MIPVSTLETNDLSAEERADAQAVFARLASGEPLDADVARRVRERSEQVRDEVFRQHGLLNVAVDLIRAARDEG